MKNWSWIERALLVAGVAALDTWLLSNADQAIYQAWQARQFDQEIRGGAASVSPPPRLPAPDPVILGRLTIPRLRLSAMVRQGVGEDTLRVALGHIPATALPGQPGNVGIAGHRDTLFRPLRLVHKNDLIVFETRSGKYVYRVRSTKIVRPGDVSVLDSKSSPELTLVTCYPFYYVGSAPERFVVEARQEPAEQALQAAGY
jgi:sortase A